MLKHVVLAAFLASGATAAYAQTPAPSQQAAAPAERTVSTGDFNKSGQMAGSAIIGAKVRNDKKETVGSIDDLYVDNDGSIKTVVVAVGGFLGVGSKAVAVKWGDLKYGRDGDALVVTTSLGKDELKAMPDFTQAERRKPAPPPATPSAPVSR